MSEADIVLLMLVGGIPTIIGNLSGEAWGWVTLIIICALLIALWRLTAWVCDLLSRSH